jgi:hypothetical protein
VILTTYFEKLHGWIPLLFGLVVLCTGLWSNDFEYDTDEGINLMKALLLSNGYSLYRQIWSDQPPVFTYALAGWFEVFGPGVIGSRILVLLLSILLLWSFQQTLRFLENERHAWVATLLLAGANWYALYSFSVMIGLPALAVGMMSVWLVVVFRKTGAPYWALLAGTVMGVSIQIKAFTGLILPMIGVMCLVSLRPVLDQVPFKKRVTGLGLYTVGLVLTFWVILYATGTDLWQLTQPHLKASELNPDKSISPVLTLMRRDWMLAVLACSSLLLMTRKHGWRHALPFIWFATAALVLHNHWPVWRHHGLLLMIPTAWAAGRMVIHLWDRGWKWSTVKSQYWARVAVCLIIGWGTYTACRAIYRLAEGHDGAGPRLIRLLEQNTGASKWVYTDRLMLAFRAGLMVPPPLAVISVKRQKTGELSDERIIEVLKTYQPYQLLLDRLNYGPAFYEYLKQHYVLNHRVDRKSLPDIQHYLRKPTPAAPLIGVIGQ